MAQFTKDKTKGTTSKTKAKAKAKADQKMLDLLAAHEPTGGKKLNRHEKQDAALQDLIESGTQKEREQFHEHISGTSDQVKANREAITKNVRLGGLNELLRTADTPDAAARSMDVVDDVQPSQPDSSGGVQNWLQYQRATSGPTENFVFQGTSASKSGKGVIQDSHTNALMKEGGKPTVGETSWKYHNDPDEPSLASNFQESTHVRSLANRNLKLHKDLLVTHPDQMLSTPASKRSAQTFKTKKGETLTLNDPADLEKAARISAVRGLKELTRQKRYIEDLEAASSESESDASDLDHEVDPDADSEAEAEVLWPVKKKAKGTK